MPKRIDPKVKERCVQQMLDHVSEYPSPTAAAGMSDTVAIASGSDRAIGSNCGWMSMAMRMISCRRGGGREPGM